MAAALARVPEVVEVHGLSGVADLLIQVVARDADDLYRVAGHILGIRGVKRTNTALVMRDLVDFRLTPLIDRLLAPKSDVPGCVIDSVSGRAGYEMGFRRISVRNAERIDRGD